MKPNQIKRDFIKSVADRRKAIKTGDKVESQRNKTKGDK